MMALALLTMTMLLITRSHVNYHESGVNEP